MNSRAANQARYQGTPGGCYASYKHVAKRRGIAFRLSRRQFSAYWQRPCFYCGFQIKTIGLDRVKNSQGYVPGNIVPCCTLCNRGKSDLPQARWLALCSNVVRRHGFVYARV